ncbi:hypothetical protein Hamer_G028722 [Homarus americanus]|uniref:Uncharacterized protein n=1 Tax=Homarus americanus TaxID=6706 RepID=A0A8J5K438_HOMAM|nr:hypothetical protein Hamer_G028722 [Homarus americanus]
MGLRFSYFFQIVRLRGERLTEVNVWLVENSSKQTPHKVKHFHSAIGVQCPDCQHLPYPDPAGSLLPSSSSSSSLLLILTGLAGPAPLTLSQLASPGSLPDMFLGPTEICKIFISKLGTKTSNLHGHKNIQAGRWCKLLVPCFLSLAQRYTCT